MGFPRSWWPFCRASEDPRSKEEDGDVILMRPLLVKSTSNANNELVLELARFFALNPMATSTVFDLVEGEAVRSCFYGSSICHKFWEQGNKNLLCLSTNNTAGPVATIDLSNYNRQLCVGVDTPPVTWGSGSQLREQIAIGVLRRFIDKSMEKMANEKSNEINEPLGVSIDTFAKAFLAQDVQKKEYRSWYNNPDCMKHVTISAEANQAEPRDVLILVTQNAGHGNETETIGHFIYNHRHLISCRSYDVAAMQAIFQPGRCAELKEWQDLGDVTLLPNTQYSREFPEPFLVNTETGDLSEDWIKWYQIEHQTTLLQAAFKGAERMGLLVEKMSAHLKQIKGE